MSRPTRVTDHLTTSRQDCGSDEHLSTYYTNPRRELAQLLKHNHISLTGRVLEVGCAAGGAGPQWRRLVEFVLSQLFIVSIIEARRLGHARPTGGAR